jgi:hypothetical protein
MDVKFEVQDLFEKLRPNTKIHESIEEAAEALNEIVAKQIKPIDVAAEGIGEGSDGMSEKSDEEEDDQRRPIDDDEPEEEEEKPEDLDVYSFINRANHRRKMHITLMTMKMRRSFSSIAMLNRKSRTKNLTATLPVSCRNPSNRERELQKLLST